MQPLTVVGNSDKHGSIVRFKADPLIFDETTHYDFETLNSRIRQLAFLNKGILLVLRDERDENVHEVRYQYKGGLREYVAFLNKNKQVIHDDIVYVEGSQEGIEVEIAMQYNEGYQPNIYSFCNNINTMEGLSLIHILNEFLEIYK